MSDHQVRVQWRRQDDERFTDLKYSRAHLWLFDGGISIAASSAPSSVPIPYSRAENVDPEEAFVASISSCHMLTFIWLAAKDRFVIDAYEDLAIGHLSRDARNRLAVTHVRLAPQIVFSGSRPPSSDDVQRLHHAAHEECFIANSVRAEITIEGDWRPA